MKAITVQADNGRTLVLEDVGYSYWNSFNLDKTGRVIGVGRNADGHTAICVWKESRGEYRHHTAISLRNAGHDDDMVTITTPTRMVMKLGQPPVCKDIEIIVVG